MSIYCNVYTTTGSPHDHAAYAQQGPSLVSSAPPSQSGYLYASSSLPALPLYPVPPPTFRMGPQHKNQLATSGWTPTATESSPTMAITIPHNDRLAPATTASTSGRPSRTTRDGYGSDQGGERTPPSGGSHPPKESKKKMHQCMMCHKSFDRPSTLRKHLLVHTGEKGT
ncbi:transcription factor [Ganoderma sinense ZZ0214-1]|uniref:Transcription factor n=1 Tax=Ganoderma sinense ZZ0214-1 TaxID=1077348 RepID=A0A2G8SAQ8_9APHY|nr:transcription factor [Ganoderma sinense ZZ0214-1]